MPRRNGTTEAKKRIVSREIGERVEVTHGLILVQLEMSNALPVRHSCVRRAEAHAWWRRPNASIVTAEERRP
jgi:hypothetical protein